MMEPDILLLDEPFSALDYQTRLTVCDDISSIIKKEHKTAILVTHDLAEAISVGESVYVLTKRPGRFKAAIDLDFCNDLSSLDVVIQQHSVITLISCGRSCPTMNKIKTHSDYLKSVFRHKVLIHFLRIFWRFSSCQHGKFVQKRELSTLLYSVVQNGLLNVLLN